jgi:hypothetical protein
LYVKRILFVPAISISKDNEAARRRLRGVYENTLRKPTTLPTKLAEESEMAALFY